MKRARSMVALLLAWAAAAALGQTTDRSAAPSRIAGTWQVAYEDLALGEIDGVATVAADGRHVNIVLRPPGGGREFKLTAESVVEQGDDYTMILIGESPSAATLLPDAKTQLQATEATSDSLNTVLRRGVTVSTATGQAAPKPLVLAPPIHPVMSQLAVSSFKPGGLNQPAVPPPDVHVTVPNNATKIVAAVADYHGEVELKPRHPVETQRVELRLHFAASGASAAHSGPPGDLLTGTWRFFADPLTWRDDAGKGRVGYFRRDLDNPNLATQSAAEVWRRPAPPARLQLFAVGVFNLKRIDQLYLGVPTVVEAVFDEAQGNETCTVELQVGERKLQLLAHRDGENWRRFVTEPFLPGDDPRPAPAPTTRPVAPATTETPDHDL